VALDDHGRNVLRNLKWQAEDKAIPLARALRSFSQGRFEENQSGRYIIGSAGNGEFVNWQLAPGLGPMEASRIASELLDAYDESLAALQSAGAASPTDDQIFAEMMRRTKPCRVAGFDFSMMREPYSEQDVVDATTA
jgi:hypothetical protein